MMCQFSRVGKRPVSLYFGKTEPGTGRRYESKPVNTLHLENSSPVDPAKGIEVVKSPGSAQAILDSQFIVFKCKLLYGASGWWRVLKPVVIPEQAVVTAFVKCNGIAIIGSPFPIKQRQLLFILLIAGTQQEQKQQGKK